MTSLPLFSRMMSIFWQASFRGLFFSSLFVTVPALSQTAPPPDAFRVLAPPSNGPQITPYLEYQTDMAWRQDEERIAAWRNVRTEADMSRMQRDLREKLLKMIGGLPKTRTPLRARITGTIPMNGFHIKKVIFESLPGFYVTALLYVPDDRESGKDQKVSCHSRCGRTRDRRQDSLPDAVSAARTAWIRGDRLGSGWAGGAQPVLGCKERQESLQPYLRRACRVGKSGLSGGYKSGTLGNLGWIARL